MPRRKGIAREPAVKKRYGLNPGGPLRIRQTAPAATPPPQTANPHQRASPSHGGVCKGPVIETIQPLDEAIFCPPRSHPETNAPNDHPAFDKGSFTVKRALKIVSIVFSAMAVRLMTVAYAGCQLQLFT